MEVEDPARLGHAKIFFQFQLLELVVFCSFRLFYYPIIASNLLPSATLLVLDTFEIFLVHNHGFFIIKLRILLELFNVTVSDAIGSAHVQEYLISVVFTLTFLAIRCDSILSFFLIPLIRLFIYSQSPV